MDENTAHLSTLSRGAPAGGPAPAGIATTGRQKVFSDIGMRIDRAGTWHYRGSPIGRAELVRLFASVLRRDDNGDHWLITPAEIAPVTVDDAPFMAVAMARTGEGRDQVIEFRTNVGVAVTLDGDHPLRMMIDAETGASAPYLFLDGGLRAKLNRATYYELVSLAVEETVEQAQIHGIWSCGVFHGLGDAGDIAEEG